MRSLGGQVFLLTGGSSGIGKATARALIKEGAKLIVNGRSSSKLEGAFSEFSGDIVKGVIGDCSIPEVTKEMAAKALAKWGRIDGVIANAGTGFFGSILSSTDQQVIETINTNFLGTINLVRAGLPHLLKSNQGDVVIVSSAAGYRGNANEAIYAGTKHAQVGFAGSLDRELRRSGIRVSLVCPAGTNTAFALGHGRTEGDPLLNNYLNPETVAFQILTILKMPLTVRTQSWNTWSMQQDS